MACYAMTRNRCAYPTRSWVFPLQDISIGGAIVRATNFADKVSLLSENGAKTVLVPMDNLQEMATLPATILGKTDVPFYGNGQMIIQKII